MSSNLYYCRQTTTVCKGIPYPSSTHPYKYGTSGCVYTSGCGVCASLMALRNQSSATYDTRAWTNKCIAMGARAAEGTDMAVVAKYLKKNFDFEYSRTTDMNKLVSHLNKGYKAVINVSGGGKQLFSDSGHYVFAGGIDESGNLIILDPYWYDGKFTLTANRRKYCKVKNSREVYVSPSALKSDVSAIWLFTPSTTKYILYSVNDVNYRKPEPQAPAIKDGTYTLTNVRGVYNGYGAVTGRKDVKELTVDGQKHATSSKPNSQAYLKAGTKVTISETKLLSTGNLWAKIPSGYFCVWEHDIDKTFVK